MEYQVNAERGAGRHAGDKAGDHPAAGVEVAKIAGAGLLMAGGVSRLIRATRCVEHALNSGGRLANRMGCVS